MTVGFPAALPPPLSRLRSGEEEEEVEEEEDEDEDEDEEEKGGGCRMDGSRRKGGYRDCNHECERLRLASSSSALQ